jgi:hypothetical protein
LIAVAVCIRKIPAKPAECPSRLAINKSSVNRDTKTTSDVIIPFVSAGPVASVPSFAAGAALWTTALLLISIPGEFATPVRLLGLASAILLAITTARIFWGEQLLPTSAPLPFYGYPFLVMTFVGWICSLLGERE